MEKEVLIHVKGLHMMDTPEGDEPIEIVVPGEYYFRNGSHYLRYEEMLDEQGNPYPLLYMRLTAKTAGESGNEAIDLLKIEE